MTGSWVSLEWKRWRAGADSVLEGEEGSASLQMVVILPALFLLMFLGLQFALYYHARSVAVAAAAEGARAAGAYRATIGEGLAAASGFVTDAGGADVLLGASVSGTRTATAATVRISGGALSVIPGWTPLVEVSVTAPVERVTR